LILTVLALVTGLVLVVALFALSNKKLVGAGVFEDPSARLLPSPEVVHALFNPRDRHFALRQNSPELVAMLERQRRSAALLWLASLRREALTALSNYRAESRQMPSINLIDQMRIAWQGFMFLALHSLLVVLVRSVSVFRVEGLLRELHGLSLPLLGCAVRQTPALGARLG
jgi:hypothetical protein